MRVVFGHACMISMQACVGYNQLLFFFSWSVPAEAFFLVVGNWFVLGGQSRGFPHRRIKGDCAQLDMFLYFCCCC